MIVEDLINVCVFVIESQSEDESTRDRDWYMQLFPLYILPLFTVDRYAIDCVSRVLQLYASLPVIYSANESLNPISLCVIVYIFAYGSEIVRYSLTGNWRDIVYVIGTCRNFCVLCQCRIGIITWDYSAVPNCTTCKKWSVHPFIRTAILVNGVNLSYNLEYSAKIPVIQVIRIKIAH